MGSMRDPLQSLKGDWTKLPCCRVRPLDENLTMEQIAGELQASQTAAELDWTEVVCDSRSIDLIEW